MTPRIPSSANFPGNFQDPLTLLPSHGPLWTFSHFPKGNLSPNNVKSRKGTKKYTSIVGSYRDKPL